MAPATPDSGYPLGWESASGVPSHVRQAHSSKGNGTRSRGRVVAHGRMPEVRRQACRAVRGVPSPFDTHTPVWATGASWEPDELLRHPFHKAHRSSVMRVSGPRDLAQLCKGPGSLTPGLCPYAPYARLYEIPPPGKRATTHFLRAYGFILTHRPQRPLSYLVNMNRAALSVPSFRSRISS